MDELNINDAPGGKFHLSKWFLDFIGESGESMIFYSAKLKWHGWSVSYTSWLRYNGVTGVILKSRFHHVQVPKVNYNTITWEDTKFGVSGTWESMEKMIQTRIFQSKDGSLDWKCFQPASKVQLRIADKVLEGRGYAEQLILTIPPWRIPMDELRWGRFGSDKNNMVWIELREKVKQQWLWLNGEKIAHCIIEDDHISLPDHDAALYLDRGVVLESEKKITSLVQKMTRYMPGINKIIPVNFMMADEFKWLSKCEFQGDDNIFSHGMSIHERVNFKVVQP